MCRLLFGIALAHMAASDPQIKFETNSSSVLLTMEMVQGFSFAIMLRAADAPVRERRIFSHAFFSGLASGTLSIANLPSAAGQCKVGSQFFDQGQLNYANQALWICIDGTMLRLTVTMQLWSSSLSSALFI